MTSGFLNLPWFAWTGLALLVAVIYSFVWPKKAVTETSGPRYFMIRWGHALVWILLAVSCLLRGIGPDLNGGSTFFALAAGMMYVAFLAMTFMVKKS